MRRRRHHGRAGPDVLAVIALGGMVGATARFKLSEAIPAQAGHFPWATFWTNMSGSLLLGFMLSVLIERFPPTRYVRPFLATGILGAYTTMSTYTVETALLIKDGHPATACRCTGSAASRPASSSPTQASSPPATPLRTTGSGRDARTAPMTNLAWFGFLVAAAVGAPARYVIDGFVQDHTDGAFPWGTFVVNVSGCFILGVVTGLGMYHDLGSTTRTVLGTGGMGAYYHLQHLQLRDRPPRRRGRRRRSFPQRGSKSRDRSRRRRRRPRIGRCPLTPNRDLAADQHVVNWHGSAARRVGEPSPSR